MRAFFLSVSSGSNFSTNIQKVKIKQKKDCISEIFKTNTWHQFFDYKIAVLNASFIDLLNTNTNQIKTNLLSETI